MRVYWLMITLLFVATGCMPQSETAEVSTPHVATHSDNQQSSGISPNARPSFSPTPRLQSTTSTLEAILTTNDTNAQVNVRATPSVTSKLLGYGRVGDRVIVIKQAASADGDRYTWYQVRFPNSGAIGWIREDFIRLRTSQIPKQQ
jgi:hypothetical protein